MPFFLIALGAVLVAAAINGRHKELGDLWLSEISGQGSFLNIVVVLLILGALGAITGLRGLAIGFMTLVLVVLFLSNAGTVPTINIISKLRAQLLGGREGPATNPTFGTPPPTIH